MNTTRETGLHWERGISYLSNLLKALAWPWSVTCQPTTTTTRLPGFERAWSICCQPVERPSRTTTQQQGLERAWSLSSQPESPFHDHRARNRIGESVISYLSTLLKSLQRPPQDFRAWRGRYEFAVNLLKGLRGLLRDNRTWRGHDQSAFWYPFHDHQARNRLGEGVISYLATLWKSLDDHHSTRLTCWNGKMRWSLIVREKRLGEFCQETNLKIKYIHFCFANYTLVSEKEFSTN